MVGVPGRAKGCSTCRKRKKKCDLQTPTCGNCSKGNYDCGGYQREMLIVHVDNSGKGTYRSQKPVGKRTSPPKKQPLAACSPADPRLTDLNRTSFETLSYDAFGIPISLNLRRTLRSHQDLPVTGSATPPIMSPKAKLSDAHYLH
ncbi:hypothetical protein K458DRAFT_416371 [Lentithecium fluviatile CBS 122367]|uniref:Zn(2)-C6 fungal-type domain-containing protein n=1 Tax=Lentithecium fluviatile CBS 122367 TaxID=1168545 RepID=A0A6G1J667_9PLEO|nr:hypothetical protein K458DRAFT_416371 [Lentithecium fluviatile CBS 122367]